ncbi:MAG TPA: glycosyltransferase [Candidatus Baltobacteraceae bacterium]|jgi:cellulose synthase/poly-beta-1,6-N-acetylglucosamine synthase-like glycosyltransferase|nr:glycosyltransferase [Candidatus Baltobacteraceae bacterium]
MSNGLHYPWDLIVLVVEVCLFIYFLFVNGYYVFTAILALLNLPLFMRLHRVDPLRRSYSSLDTPVSMIVPAHNEEEVIVKTVRSLLAMEYPTFEVIVVNDGSTDQTLEKLGKEFSLEPYPEAYRVSIPTEEVREIYRSAEYPELIVIDKVNGGKADALNAGLNVARYPLVLSGDADSYYHSSTLQWMSEPFQKDGRTMVVGGAIAVGNNCIPEQFGDPFNPSLPKKMLPRFQALEYLRAFLSNRLGWAPLNALGIVSGACGLWRKDLLVEAGGYRRDTVWEDMEMTLRVHHMMRRKGRAYRVAFTPYPVCWTMVPDSLSQLYTQRVLWHRHLSECMSIHRRLLFGGGALGWMTLPYLVFFEWLAPLVVTFGILFGIAGIVFGFLDWYSQIVLLGLVLTLAILISFVAILLDEISFTAYRLRDIWNLFLAAFLENFGYRQFVSIASLVGFINWAMRTPHRGRRPPGMFVKPYPKS